MRGDAGLCRELLATAADLLLEFLLREADQVAMRARVHAELAAFVCDLTQPRPVGPLVCLGRIRDARGDRAADAHGVTTELREPLLPLRRCGAVHDSRIVPPESVRGGHV